MLRLANDRRRPPRRRRRSAAKLACVVCGCTHDRACPGGCCWVGLRPPVCSACVQKYVMALLWELAFAVESASDTAAAGEAGDRGYADTWDERLRPAAFKVKELRQLYADVNPSRWDLPTLPQLAAIQRRAREWVSANNDRAAIAAAAADQREMEREQRMERRRRGRDSAKRLTRSASLMRSIPS